MTGPVPTRTIMLWCPDWPIVAATLARGVSADSPIALMDGDVVFACSAAARTEGVRTGQRLRDAQVRCPRLLVLPYEQAVDLRSFEPVIGAIEETMPGVQLLRPGLCAMRARGPARYYGGEEEAALWLLDALDGLGIPGARVGIADGPFTAQLAARAPHRSRIEIVPQDGSAAYLAPCPVGLLGDPALVTLLRRLGIGTLGDFAALPARDVADRFGEAGAWLHALAGGRDGRAVVPRVAPREFDSAVAFEPPLDRIDQATFGFRASAARFVEQLVRAKLVCTAIRIEVETESGGRSERSWLHPRSFTAADVVDRLRWQLQGGGPADGGPDSPIARIRVVPESVDAIGNHEQGLWGTAADERIHHGLSRVQSMLGHGGVLTAAVGGGRGVHDRQRLIPWGDRLADGKPATRPWPGRLPVPAPSTVFAEPRPVLVLSAAGEQVEVDDRGMLSAEPSAFSADGRSMLAVSAWAGPWPIDERWWDAAQSRRAQRFQLVGDDGTAWLLVIEGHHWWAEARYD